MFTGLSKPNITHIMLVLLAAQSMIIGKYINLLISPSPDPTSNKEMKIYNFTAIFASLVKYVY